MQFRVRDYGFESCRLVFALPSYRALSSDNVTFKSYELGPYSIHSQSLDVWAVQTEARLDVPSPTQAIPTRGSLLWSFDLDGSAISQEGVYLMSDVFQCHSGSLMTFEFTCGGGSSQGCAVDFWQDALNVEPLMGRLTCQFITL